MKEMGAYLGLPVFLLVSIWGALSTVAEMTDKLNKMRNSALGLAEGERAIPKELRYEIFKNDWIPLWICLVIAVAVLAAIFCLIPALFKSMHKQSKGDVAVWAKALMETVRFGFTHLEIACYGLGLLALVACLAILLAGLSDLEMVRTRALSQLSEAPSSPFAVGDSYEATIQGLEGPRVFKVMEVRGDEWIRAEFKSGASSSAVSPVRHAWLSAENLLQVREVP